MSDLTAPWPLSSESIELHVRLASIITLLPHFSPSTSSSRILQFSLIGEWSWGHPQHPLTWHLQLSFDRWRQSWRARAKGFRVPHRAATVVLSLAWCPVAFTLGTTPSRIMTLFLHPEGASMYHRCNLSIMSACIRVNV